MARKTAKKKPVGKKKNLTVQDVADACGVSRQVASAIIGNRRGHSGYSEETRQRVLRTIEEIGYRPHRGSLSLKHRRHGNVALIFSSFFHLPSDIFLTILAKRLVEWDYQVVLEPKQAKWQDQRFLKEDCVDAVITFQDIPEEMYRQMQKFNIPCLAVNSNFDLDVTRITYDDAQGTRMLVEQLRHRGRRKVAYLIHSVPDSHYGKTRSDTMLEMDRKYADIQCSSQIAQCTRTTYGGYAFHNVNEILQENPGLDGIILNHYRDQPGVLEELLRLGVRVPEDISLLSFFAPQVGPARLAIDPTGINIEGENLAGVMGEMLEVLGNGGKPESRCMPYHWIDGGSF